MSAKLKKRIMSSEILPVAQATLERQKGKQMGAQEDKQVAEKVV